MATKAVDPSQGTLMVTGVAVEEDQPRVVEEAIKTVKEKAFYMKRAMVRHTQIFQSSK